MSSYAIDHATRDLGVLGQLMKQSHWRRNRQQMAEASAQGDSIACNLTPGVLVRVCKCASSSAWNWNLQPFLHMLQGGSHGATVQHVAAASGKA